MYKCTGYSTNFQYLASGCSSGLNPNGLGIGGQVKHFALFLDASLDHGHSYPSATYNNTTLSKSHNFEIDVVEVWMPKSQPLLESMDSTTTKGGGVLSEAFETDRKILQLAGVFTETPRER